MPRGIRPKPSTSLVSEEVLKAIKSYRPLRLFINKQKRKGNSDNPFTLRVQFCQLPLDKQSKYLQKAVDKYIQLLDEHDVEEYSQTECKLFDYLLLKSEQKKYFQSINAPEKPPGSVLPFYSQTIKQENFEDSELGLGWNSLSTTEQGNFKKLRKQAKAAYLTQIRNFANDLPERLRIDYLNYSGQSQNRNQAMHNSFMSDHDDTIASTSTRPRRKSLAALPDSLQMASTSMSSPDNRSKLVRMQVDALHQIMPSVLYYQLSVPDNQKPTFKKTTSKNAHIRSLYNQLTDDEKLTYIFKSIKKWNGFLESNPNVVMNLIPTLHILLYKNEEILLYLSAIGLPERPPINSYLLFNNERDEIGSQQTWSQLSQSERSEYSQQLVELKNEYYEKLVAFVDHTLQSDYMRYEFFRNVKYAVKDYEAATKMEICDKTTGQLKLIELNSQKIAKAHDINQFNQIKQRILMTPLTHEQMYLIEELTRLSDKYMQ